MRLQRIDKLGYFTAVNVETPAASGTTDQVDVDVAVVEKPTGRLLFGAGFGSSDGLVLSGSIAQENIFGSGRHLSLGVNTSKINTTYALSYTNPYATVDGVSRGFDVYYRKVNAADNNLGQYDTKTAGVALRLGVPVTEYDAIQYGIGYEDTEITTFPTSPSIYKDYVNTFGSSPTNLYLTAAWQRDRRDSLIYPTSGELHRATAEVGTPAADLEYYKLSYRYQRYFPLTRLYTLMVNGEIGYGDGYSQTPLPFFKNFYAGGINSVRGYDTGSLGPVDEDPEYGTQRLGGTRRIVGTVEMLFPMPGSGLDKTVRLGTFIDGGQVWGANQKVALGDMRFSAGVSLTWSSPMGPLKFSLGVPLNSQEGDKTQPLQFTMGQVF